MDLLFFVFYGIEYIMIDYTIKLEVEAENPTAAILKTLLYPIDIMDISISFYNKEKDETEIIECSKCQNQFFKLNRDKIYCNTCYNELT